jgi:ATP-binding cassette subfamily B protein RaxB
MALLGAPMLVEEVKARAGTTARGLTLKQLRDGLHQCGVEADAVYFDVSQIAQYPRPGIVLLSHGHYVVLATRRGERLEIFDPQLGWSWTTWRKLKRRCAGFAIQVRGLTAQPRAARARGGDKAASLPLRTIMKGRSARTTLAVFAIAQLVTLTLPLLSMWSVDRSGSAVSLGLFGAIAVGFAVLSVTNIMVALLGELIQGKTKRIAAVALSRIAFDSLALKPAYWFELNGSASLQNRVTSMNAQLDFHLDVIRAFGTLFVTTLFGVAALIFISPWLIVPGFCSLALSILVDLLLEQSQRNQIASAVETSQRRQAFVLDTLWQLPVIARFGALAPARTRFASLVRTAATVDARLQSLRGWRTALTSLLKSGETLFFVTLSATFMAAGEFTIGGFVALGAYKDLLAGALASIFQLKLRRRALEVHTLQAAPLLSPAASGDPTSGRVLRGDVRFDQVSFAYGSLDRPVLRGVDFHARAGECTVLRGPSGSGKSTIAKLLVKGLMPTAGAIFIDGLPVADRTEGMAAVLQSDRLVCASIRDNVAFFRRNVTDEDILAALRCAAIEDFVLDLPMGLNTLVGEGMSGLSGGQRQRLLIARAALGAPKLLILDEATSSLEVAVEAQILEGLRAWGTTTILIAHRPEVWALADRIYSVDEEGGVFEEPSRLTASVASGGLVPAIR